MHRRRAYQPSLAHDLESLVKLLCVQTQPWQESVLLLLKARQDDFSLLLSLWQDIERESCEPWPTLFDAARRNDAGTVFSVLRQNFSRRKQ